MTKIITEMDSTIGQRIRYYRRLADMSQAELALEIGISWQQIQKYEYGKNRVPAARLYEIASVLGYPITRFFQPLRDFQQEVLRYRIREAA